MSANTTLAAHSAYTGTSTTSADATHREPPARRTSPAARETHHRAKAAGFAARPQAQVAASEISGPPQRQDRGQSGDAPVNRSPSRLAASSHR